MSHKSKAMDDLWHNLRGNPGLDEEIAKMVGEIGTDRRWTGEQVATLSEIVFRTRMALGDMGIRVGECKGEASPFRVHTFNSDEACIYCGARP